MSPIKRIPLLAAAAVAGVLVVVAGCAPGAHPTDATAAAQPAAAHEKAGAQLWAENCSRCHNLRPPESFSDAQWATIVHHMRFRANLTGVEARKVTEFLQAVH